MYSKKKLVVFSISIVIVFIVFIMQTTKNIVINVRDYMGSPVADAEILLYSYKQQEPILIASGVTNGKGRASIRSSIFNMAPDSTGEHYANAEVYYSYTLQVAHPVYGVVTENWSDKKKRESKKLELTYVINEHMSQAFQNLDYQGSGIYRTKKIGTIKTLENTVVGLLICDSSDPDFTVEIFHSPGVEYDVQAKRQTIFPLVDSWKEAGWIRIVKNQATANRWFNTAVAENYDGRYVSTDFKYIQEVWEYQEQDKKSRDVWHTRQRWVEVKADGVHGSTMYGSMVKLEDNLVPIQELTKENVPFVKVEANIPRTIVIDTSYYFTNACDYNPNIEGYTSVTPTTFDVDVHYNSSFKFTFGSRTYNKDRYVYDNITNGNGAIWYIAGE